MKTEIYFIQHAESDISIKDDYERPLTKNGINSSQKISEVQKRNIDTLGKILRKNKGKMAVWQVPGTFLSRSVSGQN